MYGGESGGCLRGAIGVGKGVWDAHEVPCKLGGCTGMWCGSRRVCGMGYM